MQSATSEVPMLKQNLLFCSYVYPRYNVFEFDTMT